MNGIEGRLKRLEARLGPPDKSPRHSHIVAGLTAAETDAKIAELLANGTAGPDDFFVCLLPPGAKIARLEQRL
jgi:hypothetical protein